MEKNKRKKTSENICNFPRVTKLLSVVRTSLDDFLEHGGDSARSTIIEKAEYGTQVHSLCNKFNEAMIDGDVLSVEQIADGLYYDGVKEAFSKYRDWVLDNVEAVIESEMEIFHGKYKYRGHLDLVARIKGDDTFSVIDIKTPETVSRTWFLQIEAYRRAFNEMMKQQVAKRGFALITTPSGCRVKESSDPNDSLFANFLYAKSLYQYMKGGKG